MLANLLYLYLTQVKYLMNLIIFGVSEAQDHIYILIQKTLISKEMEHT